MTPATQADIHESKSQGRDAAATAAEVCQPRRQGRTRMIDELCEQLGYSRKHAIKLLGARTSWGGDPAVRKGRPHQCGDEVVEVLWRIWKVSEQPCGKRLVEMFGLWLPHYEAEHGQLAPKVHKQLKAISAAQVDRLLAPHKAQCKHRGRSGTKPRSLLKHHISIRADNWDITKPGWLEADTVTHRNSPWRQPGATIHFQALIHKF